MNRKKICWLAAVVAYATTAVAQIEKVNPVIGTDGMGHTFPGACVPFGMIQLSPDTDTIPHNVDGVYQPDVYAYCAGYQYHDSTIVGFSHTHMSGTGHSDLGDILLMPTTGALKLNPGTKDCPDAGYRSRFSHETEKATPGYYEVKLDDYDVKVQLTTTPRVGIHKYTYPKGTDGRVILDLNHGIYNYDGKLCGQISVLKMIRCLQGIGLQMVGHVRIIFILLFRFHSLLKIMVIRISRKLSIMVGGVSFR